MIDCKQCQTQNGLDSKFCKNRGQALSDDAIQQATGKHEKMVKEGYALFNAGLTDDALLAAQAAVAENPNSPNAYSLLGMCLERSGQLAEALECYERVVSLAPDSALERMKITQLRSSLTNRLKTDNKLNKKFALVSGLCLMIILSVAGITLATVGTRKAVAATAPPPVVAPPDTRPFTVPDSRPAVVAQNAPPVAQAAPSPQDVRPYIPPARSASNDSDSSSRDDNSDNGIERPVSPTLLKNPTAIIPPDPGAADPSANSAPSASQDPSPAPDNSQKVAVADKAQDPPKEDPGIIEITVSRRSANAGPAESEGSSPNQLQALLKTARNEFLLGRYDAAARAYERALSNGGDPATLNQRLGMCYEKLGRTSDAVSAYNHAANAFEVALNFRTG